MWFHFTALWVASHLIPIPLGSELYFNTVVSCPLQTVILNAPLGCAHLWKNLFPLLSSTQSKASSFPKWREPAWLHQSPPIPLALHPTGSLLPSLHDFPPTPFFCPFLIPLASAWLLQHPEFCDNVKCFVTCDNVKYSSVQSPAGLPWLMPLRKST